MTSASGGMVILVVVMFGVACGDREVDLVFRRVRGVGVSVIGIGVDLVDGIP